MASRQVRLLLSGKGTLFMLARPVGFGLRFLALSVAIGSLAACSTTSSTTTGKSSSSKLKEYFSAKEYGVPASERVVDSGPIPRGGGRAMVGKPYVVKGKRYIPRLNKNYDRVGYASWYGAAFHGRYTSNGEIYDKNALSAASPTMPLPSYARVTNLENGSSVIVRVNDRGPFARGRIIDLSSKTADLLNMKKHGTAKVRVKYVGPARLDGRDQAFLMASYIPKGGRLAPDPMTPGVMIASAGNSVPASALSDIPVPTAAPVLALANTSAPAPQFQAISATLVSLPEFGPIPALRPALADIDTQSLRLVTGYVNERKDTSSNAFKAVLNDHYGLSAEKIRESYERQHGDARS